MSLSANGDFQLVSQLYNYKGRRIACSVKVLPTPATVTHFEREATNDYYWMTPVRWARIEIALYRIFENLDLWRDAKNLREELLVDHINVRIQATEKPHHATISLLAGAELEPDDLSLDIQLQYMAVEDTSIVGMHTTKRKLATEAGANGTVQSSSSGLKRKAGIKKKAIQSKPKHIDADDEDDDDCPASSENQPPTKVKRERRSISQGADIQEENSSNNGSSSRRGKRRSLSTSERNSTASSGESKVARRSRRSPIRPSRFNNFVLSNAEQKKRKLGIIGTGKSKEKPSPVKKVKGKPTTSSAAKAVKEKPITSSPAKAVKEKSLTPTPAESLMDEARLSALQRLDSMLAIPKPPEVEILLLENMSEGDVLATFEGYRRDFDKLFQERKNKGQTLSYLNVSHMDVLDILNSGIRYKMMKKLAASYSTQSCHTSLVINGLLPLWIVRLFTDTYKLSHEDAARHIKDQLLWSSYLKALNNDPLDSDLDD